jgi:hypothetical protein
MIGVGQWVATPDGLGRLIGYLDGVSAPLVVERADGNIGYFNVGDIERSKRDE